MLPSQSIEHARDFLGKTLYYVGAAMKSIAGAIVVFAGAYLSVFNWRRRAVSWGAMG